MPVDLGKLEAVRAAQAGLDSLKARKIELQDQRAAITLSIAQITDSIVLSRADLIAAKDALASDLATPEPAP